MVDLIKMKAVIWKDESLGAEFEYTDIPADLADQAAEYREKLVETGRRAGRRRDGGLSRRQRARRGDAARCIRKGTLPARSCRCFCGSAFKNKGVQPLLDAVVDYLPSPLDVPAVKGVKPDERRREHRAPELR